jgi:prepilin-type processing-associated H-X9-DG protein
MVVARSAQTRPTRIGAIPRVYYLVNHPFYSDVHDRGGNLLFCDGHASYRRKRSIAYAEFGFPPALNANKPAYFADDPAQAAASHSTPYIAEF